MPCVFSFRFVQLRRMVIIMRYRKIKGDAPAETPKKPKWIRLLRLAASFIVLLAIYVTGIKYEWKPIVYIYFGLLTVSFIVYFIINRGFDNKPVTPDMLPDDWDFEQKRVYMEDDAHRKSIARNLMYLIIPLMLIIGLDIVYMALTIK